MELKKIFVLLGLVFSSFNFSFSGNASEDLQENVSLNNISKIKKFFIANKNVSIAVSSTFTLISSAITAGILTHKNFEKKKDNEEQKCKRLAAQLAAEKFRERKEAQERRKKANAKRWKKEIAMLRAENAAFLSR